MQRVHESMPGAKLRRRSIAEGFGSLPRTLRHISKPIAPRAKAPLAAFSEPAPWAFATTRTPSANSGPTEVATTLSGDAKASLESANNERANHTAAPAGAPAAPAAHPCAG